MNLTEAVVFGLILFCAWLNWCSYRNKAAIKSLKKDNEKLRECVHNHYVKNSTLEAHISAEKTNWGWRQRDINNDIARLAKKLPVPFYTILVGDTFSTDPDGDILIRFVQVGPDDPNARPMSGEATQYRLDRYTPVYRR